MVTNNVINLSTITRYFNEATRLTYTYNDDDVEMAVPFNDENEIQLPAGVRLYTIYLAQSFDLLSTKKESEQRISLKK